jgi:CheY-like chemotaxis protein
MPVVYLLEDSSLVRQVKHVPHFLLKRLAKPGLARRTSRIRLLIFINTQFDVSLSSAFRVQLVTNGPRTGRAMLKRILVADDSAMIRKCLCRIFEIEEDYDICAEAVNGEEAIALAKQHKPDLIVLDYQMPVMNGIEAARELKRIMPDVPIILFTLHAEAMQYSIGQHSPIDLVVAKSDAVHIVDHIRSLIPV